MGEKAEVVEMEIEDANLVDLIGDHSIEGKC